MKRKQFVARTLGTAAAGWAALAGFSAPGSTRPDPPALRGPLIQPPFLKAGDTVGITCPASPLELKDMQNCRRALGNWGLQVCVGNTVGQQWERFGGTDAERAADLQLMLNDPSIKAILFARGGYGAMRIMDRLDWSAFRQQPKWLIGYSDITALHCHVHSVLGIPSLHADMVNGFREQEDVSTVSLRHLLHGQAIRYQIPAFGLNRPGQATGMIVGGNLSLVAAMLGSKSELNTAGKILFLEDVNEYKYTLDRMLVSLRRAGKFDQLAGLIIGGITATKADSETQFPMSVEALVLEKVADKTFPVCFNFPAGHIRNNMALKLGVPHQLVVAPEGCTLTEVSLASSMAPPVSIPIDSLEPDYK